MNDGSETNPWRGSSASHFFCVRQTLWGIAPRMKYLPASIQPAPRRLSLPATRRLPAGPPPAPAGPLVAPSRLPAGFPPAHRRPTAGPPPAPCPLPSTPTSSPLPPKSFPLCSTSTPSRFPARLSAPPLHTRCCRMITCCDTDNLFFAFLYFARRVLSL